VNSLPALKSDLYEAQQRMEECDTRLHVLYGMTLEDEPQMRYSEILKQINTQKKLMESLEHDYLVLEVAQEVFKYMNKYEQK
jgi:hypothetical protein